MTETVEQFLARGGEIKKVDECIKVDFRPDYLRNCSCGCNGDYTDHSMRQGEKGIY